MRYELCLAAKPLEFGPADNWRYGGDACHSFLLLRNADTHEVLCEMHGFSFDRRINMFRGKPMGEVFNLLGDMLKSVNGRASFMLGKGESPWALKGNFTEDAWRASSAEGHIYPIAQMDETNAKFALNCVANILKHVNARDVNYALDSFSNLSSNCHTVTGMMLELLRDMRGDLGEGIDAATSAMRLVMPGFSSRVGEVFSMRTALPDPVNFRMDGTLDDVIRSLEAYVTEPLGAFGYHDTVPPPERLMVHTANDPAVPLPPRMGFGGNI